MKIKYVISGLALSTGVRGKKTLSVTNSILGALDHDVCQKGSLTPSVYLNVEIPETLETFYRGQVSVILKDAVYQASSPLRHATELLQLVSTEKPVLMVYSDGGPDHLITWGSVKLSWIAVFRKLDLDMLIAFRTAPNHSWANPVERIMSMLNIAYHNVSLSREECSATVEQIIRRCSGMSALRAKAVENPELKEEWLKSVQPMIELLRERHERMALKGVCFKSYQPASEDDITKLTNDVINDIDATIEAGKYQKTQLANKTGYHEFIAKHCRERNYSFQIRKCDDAACCKPRRTDEKLEWLPDPTLLENDKSHFAQFHDVYGKETTEEDCPSLSMESAVAVAEELQVRNIYKKVLKCFCETGCFYAAKKLCLCFIIIYFVVVASLYIMYYLSKFISFSIQ